MSSVLDADDPTQVKPFALGAAAFRKRAEVSWTDNAGYHELTLEDRTVLGSALGVGLVIADPTVSRLHAEFEIRDDSVWVRDLGSRNGTYVEEVLVGSARVRDGGAVRVGSTVLSVRYSRVSMPVELWQGERLGALVGRSAAMRAVFARIARIAAKDAPVLIHGETGTGKELVAQAIHDASRRAGCAFMVVDCAALPEHLLEAELFGHARGAFTGAVGARAGAIESADGGTVFLDEIGELPLGMQPKLLRLLESHTVRRVGESEHRRVDVRFISATHRDLRKMVNAGAFREDLYFRLAVLPLEVPPLRERPEDIALLVEHFLRAHGDDSPSPDLLRELLARPWLGNVRELRSFVERAVALGASEALTLARRSTPPPPPLLSSEHSTPARSSAVSTPAPAATPSARPSGGATYTPAIGVDRGNAAASAPDAEVPFKQAREQALEQFEREYLRALLERHKRNVAQVAQIAQLDRTYLYRLLRKHSL